MSRRTPLAVDHLAQQDGAAIAELRHELAELVAGIGGGDRVGLWREPLARQQIDTVRALEPCSIEVQLACQLPVQSDQRGRTDRRRLHTGKEMTGKTRVAVVERDGKSHEEGRSSMASRS